MPALRPRLQVEADGDAPPALRVRRRAAVCVSHLQLAVPSQGRPHAPHEAPHQSHVTPPPPPPRANRQSKQKKQTKKKTKPARPAPPHPRPRKALVTSALAPQKGFSSSYWPTVTSALPRPLFRLPRRRDVLLVRSNRPLTPPPPPWTPCPVSNNESAPSSSITCLSRFLGADPVDVGEETAIVKRIATDREREREWTAKMAKTKKTKSGATHSETGCVLFSQLRRRGPNRHRHHHLFQNLRLEKAISERFTPPPPRGQPPNNVAISASRNGVCVPECTAVWPHGTQTKRTGTSLANPILLCLSLSLTG